MKTNVEIMQHANLVDEAIFLLYQWINNKDLGEIRLREVMQMNMDIEAYKKRFELLNEIFNDVTGQLKDKKDRVEFYFKERNNEFSTLGILALLWGVHRYNNQLVPYTQRVQDMDTARRVKEYAGIIQSEEAENMPKEKLQNISDLISFIEACPYESDAKWEAVRIFQNQEGFYQEVEGILSEVISIFETKYGTQIAEIEQEFYEYWSEYQKKEDIIESINDKLKISWESDKDTVIVPLLFIPYCITLSVTQTEYSDKDIIRIGLMIDSDFVIADKKLAKEDVVNVGKLLSDKSKIDILEFVSTKPRYGKEIATALNLSTATISYHVSSLLQNRFLKAEVISKKVYYTIDRERISEYLEDVKDYFTKL